MREEQRVGLPICEEREREGGRERSRAFFFFFFFFVWFFLFCVFFFFFFFFFFFSSYESLVCNHSQTSFRKDTSSLEVGTFQNKIYHPATIQKFISIIWVQVNFCPFFNINRLVQIQPLFFLPSTCP
jgi:hypothetical protein